MNTVKAGPAREWKNTFRVGVYTCEMTYSTHAGMNAKWKPDLPRRFSEQQQREYRAGRNALMAEVAAEIGNVLVIET